MGDTSPDHTSNQKKHGFEVPGKHANPSKFYNHFLFKASLLVFFLVVLPLFTSEAPDFINQTLQTRSWEVLQLIFVGIAVSYGLFSKKSDDNSQKVDNAQSYVSGLLQVSSVFDDEAEIKEENKVQTWNNQYHRGEPVVVSSRIGEKPLLLPIRSLKSRVLEESSGKIGSLSGSKSFSSNTSTSRRENIEEHIVRASPIPWRSRSARMEMKEDFEKPNPKEDPQVNKIEPFSLRSQSFRSPRPNNNNSTSLSPKNLSPSPSRKNLIPSSSETQSRIGEEVVRKKSFRKSAPPPPPPPPPPHFYRNSPLMRSSSGVKDEKTISSEKELRRNIRSVPIEPRKAYSGKEFKPFIGSTRGKAHGEEFVEETVVGNDKMMHESGSKPTYMEFPQEDEKEYVDKFFQESDQEDSETESEDDYFDQESSEKTEFATQNTSSDGANDGGPDVDKKADEFIAKFREQIRLQRIESIRKSARNFVR